MYATHNSATNAIDCPEFTDIDYRMVSVVERTKVTVTLISKGMKWKSLRVTLWLNDRDDMFVGTLASGNSN